MNLFLSLPEWLSVLARTVKRAEKTSIEEMSKHDRDRSSLSVVQGKEARRLQLPRRCGTLPLTGHAGVQSRQHRHGHGQHEKRVHQADECPQQPIRPPPAAKSSSINRREEPAIDQVHPEPDYLGPVPVSCDHGA